MGAIKSCWVNISSSVTIPRRQKGSEVGAPLWLGIKRASKEPRGCASHGGSGRVTRVRSNIWEFMRY